MAITLFSYIYFFIFETQLLASEEHAMCYNADILILTTPNTACPKVEYYPKEMPTTVEITTDSEG